MTEELLVERVRRTRRDMLNKRHAAKIAAQRFLLAKQHLREFRNERRTKDN